MTGRFVAWMKRWWVLALVFTLALSLTSCSSKKKNLQSGYGFGYCDGTIGSFDVYVLNSGKGTYELSLIPVQVNAGDLVVVTLLNQGLMLKTMVTQATIQNDQELF